MTHDEVGQVVLLIAVPVLLRFAVHRQSVVVVLGVPHLQRHKVLVRREPRRTPGQTNVLAQHSPRRSTGPSQGEHGRRLRRLWCRTGGNGAHSVRWRLIQRRIRASVDRGGKKQQEIVIVQRIYRKKIFNIFEVHLKISECNLAVNAMAKWGHCRQEK